VAKHLSEEFPTQNSLKEGDTLSTFLSNFCLVYASTNVEGNKEGPKMNGTHPPLVYAADDDDYVNLLDQNIITTKHRSSNKVYEMGWVLALMTDMRKV
jgi:hypothetical protein